MLIITSIPRDAVKTKHSYRGSDISIDIRPLNGEILAEIRESITVHEFALNPTTGKMERVPIVDDKAYDIAMYDYLIAGWSGFNKSKTEELPCTKENKIRVVSLRPGEKDKQPLSDWLIFSAGELAKRLEEELEAERKNF